MYKLLLTFRYLRRKMIPVFALLAVTLCTAMVIIVISVMGGFLDLVRNAGRTVMGDVSCYAGLGGFPHYDELITEIDKLPEAKAATPIIIAYGLLKLPGDRVQGVQVHGIRGKQYADVTAYDSVLYWTKKRLNSTDDELGGAAKRYQAVAEVFGEYDPVDAAVAMKPPWSMVKNKPVIVCGIEVSPYNVRRKDGSYDQMPSIVGRALTLSVLPVTRKGGTLEPATDQFIVVNEFNSGVYDVDAQRVYIPFDVAQKIMAMDAATQVDPDNPTHVLGTIPARATEIHIKAAPGVTADQLCAAVKECYDTFASKYDDLPPQPFMTIMTWNERQAKFLSAVENEKSLMTWLFGIISIVAVVMVGVIFYMIVLEKTRDIGILRAIGASRTGVASIFLSFGAVVGTFGAAFGTTIAYLIVVYINEIHAWLGDTSAALFGESHRIVIWDRSVYFFDRIPNRVNPNEVTVIVIVAIVASVLGALVPALKAARVNPIESLRYE